MSELRERLYKQLLPALHRARDAGEGEPLRALLGIIETQLTAIEDDIGGLYENWFVETAEPWALPYLADLLGVVGVRSEVGYSRRAYVANTLSYRRRKGTAAVLETLAFDVTGWQARAVEFFQRLCTTQHLNHVRLQSRQGVDLRPAHRLEEVGGPFEDAAHNADVRRIATAGGRYNIPNVGLYLWPLQAFLFKGATAKRVGSSGDRVYYRFESTNSDIQLFNSPRTETEVSHLAEALDVPGALSARALGQALLDPGSAQFAWWFGGAEPAFRVSLDGVVVPPLASGGRGLQIFHRWRREDPAEEEAVNDWENMVPAPEQVLVDPERGRIVLRLAPGEAEPDEVTVDYRVAFLGEVGGGPYDRSRAMGEGWDPKGAGADAWWQRGVSRAHHQGPAPHDPRVFATLTEAVAAWDAAAAAGQIAANNLISIMDSRSYEEDLEIRVPAGATLWLVAADWSPPDAASGLPTDQRLEGEAVVPAGLRPHLRGTVKVVGGAGARLILSGLRIEGSLVVGEGDLALLRLDHCTLVPGRGGVTVLGGTGVSADANASLSLVFRRTILSELSAVDTVPTLSLEDCVVDQSGSGVSLQAPGANLTAVGCTLLGSVSVRAVSLASDCLFVGRLMALRRQEGCVRFSYFPDGSQTPRAYRCQPDLALSSAAPALAASIQSRLVPSFGSVVYGEPTYAWPRRSTPEELRQGADDGDAMGVTHFLKATQRESNLRAALAQYLRGGLQAGLFFVTARSSR